MPAPPAIDAKVAARASTPARWPGSRIGVKDLEDAAGFVTTHGSAVVRRRRAGRRPTRRWWPGWWRPGASWWARPTRRSWAGRRDTDNPVFGPTRNPWNLEHSPGGSSGGSAAAIAVGHGAAGHRLRRGRVDPHPVVVLRPVRHEAVARPGARAVGRAAPDWQHLSTKGPMARRLSRRGGGPRRGGRARPDRPAVAAPARGVVVGRARRRRSRPARWRGRRPSATPRSTPRCWPSASGPSTCWPRSGTEVVEVDTVFDADPVETWLTLSGATTCGRSPACRGTAAWELVDPRAGHGASTVRPTTGALDLVRAEDACHTLNLRLVELFHDVRLLITPTVAARASAPFARRRRG